MKINSGFLLLTRLFAFVFYLAAFIVFSNGCKKETIPAPVFYNVNDTNKKAWETYYNNIPPLQPLTYRKTYTIRVQRVDDPRFPSLSEQQYKQLLADIVRDTKYFLGYNIEIREVEPTDILSLFLQYRDRFDLPKYKYHIGAHYIDTSDEKGVVRLKETIAAEIDYRSPKIIERYLPAEKSSLYKTKEQRVEYFTEQFLQADSELDKLPCALSECTLREGQYRYTQHYIYWSVLLQESESVDLFITNSIIAGADDQMPVYVINRGGITSAITENNVHNQFQGAVVLGAMPFISEAPFFLERRDKLPEILIPDILSMMVVHEFGHLFARHREYYDLPGSPWNAPVDLDYFTWYKKIIDRKAAGRVLEKLDKY